MQTQVQLGSYIHACTNEVHSLRFNPYFGSNNYRQHKLAIKSCKFVRECVLYVHAWM